MEKISNLKLEAIQLLGGRVSISEKSFKKIVEVIDIQTRTINDLIDAVEMLASQANTSDARIQTLQSSITALARAVQTLTED